MCAPRTNWFCKRDECWGADIKVSAIQLNSWVSGHKVITTSETFYEVVKFDTEEAPIIVSPAPIERGRVHKPSTINPWGVSGGEHVV